MVSLTNYFKSWDDTGTEPTGAGVDNYSKGDNPKAAHYDYLWDRLNKLFADLIANQETDAFDADASGVVDTGDAKLLYETEVEDGDELYLTQGALTLSDGTAAPTDLDLVVATLDNSGNATHQTDVITGDGSTVYDDETGDPLANYANSSGSAQTVGILVDNGHFGSGSSSSQDHYTSVKGRTEAQ